MVDLVGPGSATHRAKNLNLINEEQQKYVVIPTEPEGGLPWVSFGLNMGRNEPVGICFLIGCSSHYNSILLP